MNLRAADFFGARWTHQYAAVRVANDLSAVIRISMSDSVSARQYDAGDLSGLEVQFPGFSGHMRILGSTVLGEGDVQANECRKGAASLPVH